MLLFINGLLLLIYSAECSINLYISHSEVQRILGFDGELYYIRNGKENQNALNYQLMISENINYVRFRWQHFQESSTSTAPVFTRTAIFTLQHDLLYAPSTSLPSQGIIPSIEEEFYLNITCRPKVEGAASVYFHLNCTNQHSSAPFRLKFSFNKLCKEISISEDGNDDEDNNYLTANADDDSGAIDKTTVFYIEVGIACIIVVISAVALGLLHVHSMPKASEENEDPLLPKEEKKQEEITTKVIPQVLKAAIAEKRLRELIGMLKDFVVRRNLLSIGNTVQEGSFGRAYVGTLINAENGEEVKVLVKTVTDQASADQKVTFLMESCILKRTTHHNVLPLIHVCFDELKPPLVIYQYMNRGNLKNYLRLSRTAEPLLKPLTTRDIVLIALQIARGLQYLCRRRIIHKDVATRNCVVDEELHVKVCDNALARDFFPGDYHCLGDKENRPIRWMAAESLDTNTFVYASDVWSYGVLLWELCSLAQTPYANVDPFEMLNYLKSGLRLPQPLNCPDDFFTVMACCWALSVEERPHFTQIIACLDAFFSKLNAFI